MASSASFRARRSVDPKPIHYGSFSRDLRTTTSLNDLDAAWENVDEARTALQTVEARIREANLGLRHERHNDSASNEPPIREVFSQKQRLGRVSRYELRPTINEHQYTRDTDRSPRRTLSEFPSTRKSPRSAYTSHKDYTGSNYYDRQHSPPSRDVRSISSPYINNYVNDVDDNDLSLQRNLNSGITRDVITPSEVGNIANGADSQEVSSVKRKKLNDFSPLSPRISPTDQSVDALTRLKERIRKQKERTPTPKQKENEDAVVNVIQPSSEERLIVEDTEECSVKPVCKRKVVTAGPPIGYKGFSMPGSEPKDIRRTQSRTSNYSVSSKAGQKRSSGPHKQTTSTGKSASKGGVKMRRITAPKPPMDFITPYSWRTGMETVKKVLGPTRPKSAASTRPQSATSQDNTSLTTPRSETGKREEKQEEKWKERREEKEEAKEREKLEYNGIEEEKNNDLDLSEGLLSEEAKSILSDLDSDKSDDEDKVREVRAVLEGIGRSDLPQKGEQKHKRIGKPSYQKKRFQTKQKSPETVASKSSLQKNYDVDKVKKYMDKKIKDRKQKIREEKKMKQEAVDGRKQRLESLYNKQKKILATNLHQNIAKHKMGETHSVLPGHSRFQHQQLGYLPEFMSPEESERESTDVGSYAGLPTPSPRSQQPTTTATSDHEVSDISSDSSLLSLDSDRLYSTKRREEDKGVEEEEEDNPADVTLTPEKSKYSGGRAMNGDMEREEEEEERLDERQIRLPVIPSDEAQGPSRTDRIEALKNTAAALTHRLEQEAKRLGLSLMDEKPSVRPSNVTVREADVFKGNLPGVSNLHEQAQLNDKLENMNSAATRIQAVYRGYSTRQGLNWRLPSGQTLGGIMRNAPRQTPIEGRVESIPLYLASDSSSDSHLSDLETAYSHESDRSGYSHNRKYHQHHYNHYSHSHGYGYHSKSGSSADIRSYSTAHNNQHGKSPGSTSLSKGRYRPSTTLGKALADGKGDRMSVINIYLRNLSNLRQGEEKRPVEPVQTHEDNDTASLYSDDFQPDKTSDTASLLDDLKDDTVDLDRTLVEQSPLHDGNDLVEQNLAEPSSGVDRSYTHSAISHDSPSRSSTISLTDTEYSPIRQSTRSVSSPSEAAEVSTHLDQPSTHYRPPVFFPSRQGGDRMSPGSLDRQMIAELNRLEFMEESVRQLTDIEKTNALSLAQQETVSLAQILKAKQAAYAKDMESLQLKAQKEKIEAARELDEARYSAKKSSLDAQETIVKVKTDAANSIAQSTDRLVKAQTEASRMTTESAKKVEEARNEAAKALLDNANQQISDIRNVASTAASAAAQEAVRSTLEQYRQDQRPPRKHDMSHSTPDSRSRTHSTPDSRSRSSYLRDSFSDERSPSFSRSRSARSASERRSGASKSASGGGDGYTSDEFESFKETEPTRSVRTATPDRSHATNKLDDSFVDNRERSGTKSIDSIAEEIDASISEGSIASDSIIADKSVVEAVDDELLKVKDKTDHDYSMTFEESAVSSRNATDDEMDYRLILPSEGHRRRSIEKLQRSTSICSDAGTVSYSSDENLDKHLSESIHEKTTPFSREDSFTKFTADMVKLMREEEVRAKHLESLLHLREKALKENTKAEMEWLELQKKQMRDKGADDAMPFIKKRQRDVIKRLKTEKAEIKYLMAAHRAARYDRRLMMMNQEEITRLRRSTQKIRGKVREEEEAAVVAREKSKSDVSEALSPNTRRSTPVSANEEPDDSPSKDTTVPEEISAIESPTADTSFPTYDNEPSVSERVRKRSLSEGESDDGTPSSSVPSKSKGSPSTSDSIVMQQLKKLKSQSSERYLTQREQKLMRRKHEGEEIPLSDRKLTEWERRLADEEDKLNDVNRLRTKRAIKATQTISKEEDIVAMPPDRSRESSVPEVDYISKDISEASDHSDVETRVRELREQLQQREREVRRLHKEQKRQKRAMLHEEEENLRKKLQAVERILQKTKENLERPAAEFEPHTAAVTSTKPTPKQSTPEKSFVHGNALPSTSKQLDVHEDEMVKGERKLDKSKESEIAGLPRLSSREGSISERLPSSRDRSVEEALSESKHSAQSSTSDGPFKGVNVVLDLDFSSQNREEPSISEAKDLGDAKAKSISEVKDLDLSDRSGLFEREPSYTPFSQSEEIPDDAKTAEDVSEGSEIRTLSGASANDEPSRSQSSRESLPEVIAERSGDKSQDSISEEISEKPDERSREESISEVISARSSRRSGSESISEAISAASKSDDSISEAIPAASNRSGTKSTSEALSARSRDASFPEAKKKEASGRLSKSPVNQYSNTFESDLDKDGEQTDDDISEHLIADESRESIEYTPHKTYTSDFEPSESNIAHLDVKDKSPKNASYSQDFEAPSSKVEESSREKSLQSKRSSKEDEGDGLEQQRLSQATDEESIAEEIPEEEIEEDIEEDHHSIESGPLSDASEEATPLDSLPKKQSEQQQVSVHEDDKEASENDMSGYSQDFESSISQRISRSLSKEPESISQRISKSLSKEPESKSHEKSSKSISKEDRSASPQRASRSLSKEEPVGKLDEAAHRLGEATDEESVAEEISEDEGSLSEEGGLITPRFSLKEQQLEDKEESVHSLKPEEKREDELEEKELSYSFEDFESPSSQRISKHESKGDSHQDELVNKSLSKTEEPHPKHEVSEHRLSEATDDESVVEEIPEEDASLEIGELSADDEAPQFIDTKEKTTVTELVSPSKPEDSPLPEKKDVKISEKKVDQEELRKSQADKIAQDISTSLVHDAVTCMSNLYDEHKHKTSSKQEIDVKTSHPSVETTQTDAKAEAKSDSEKEDSMNEWGKPPEEGFEVSEGEDLSISERLSFTDDDVSLPLPTLDLTPVVSTAQRDDQISKPAEEKKEVKVDKKEQNENVLKDLSENLLKEAAAKMISLMRQKQAKLKTTEETPMIEKKELPKSPPPHSPELSPRSFDKYMAVMKQASPPGSPTRDGSGFDGNELADKLTQLKLLHDELGAHLGEDDDDDDDFVINANKPLELPTEKEEFGPPSGQAIPIVVPHSPEDVASVVSASLAAFYRRKKSGGSLGNVTPPPEFSDSNVDDNDPDSKPKQSYRRMIFDLTGEVFRDVLAEESPLERPSWMKPRRRRKNRFYHALSPVTDEHDYLPIVQQRVLDLVGLGNERPNLDTLRRKTPLKIGKKDFVDAVLIQELREEEPQWVDYDDDELAVKFQVADAIFESLLSETIMVLNAVQRRKESEREIVR